MACFWLKELGDCRQEPTATQAARHYEMVSENLKTVADKTAPIGAKLAAPERPVYCITGDGALGFHVMELETARRAGAAVIVVVAVDDAWGMEKTAYNFAGFGPEHHGAIEFTPGVRYDLMAQAMGCFGVKVDTIDELAPALQAAVQSGLPAMIHVAVDAAVNADPVGFKEFRYARTL